MQSQVDTPLSRPRKDLAIASLTLGIVGIPTLGLCYVGGIVGIVLGAGALQKAKTDPTHYTGNGFAIAGIIISTLSLVIAAAILLPNLLYSQQAARETDAFTNVLIIGKAQQLYSVTKGHGSYTNLQTLGTAGLIDSALASGEKGGYEFRSEPVLSGAELKFDTTARPVKTGNFGTGNRSFGANETLIVYEADGAVILKGTATNRIPAGGTPIQ